MRVNIQSTTTTLRPPTHHDDYNTQHNRTQYSRISTGRERAHDHAKTVARTRTALTGTSNKRHHCVASPVHVPSLAIRPPTNTAPRTPAAVSTKPAPACNDRRLGTSLPPGSDGVTARHHDPLSPLAMPCAGLCFRATPVSSSHTSLWYEPQTYCSTHDTLPARAVHKTPPTNNTTLLERLPTTRRQAAQRTRTPTYISRLEVAAVVATEEHCTRVRDRGCSKNQTETAEHRARHIPRRSTGTSPRPPAPHASMAVPNALP